LKHLAHDFTVIRISHLKARRIFTHRLACDIARQRVSSCQ